MVRPEHNPATEAITEIDHGGTAAESYHIWERRPQG